MILPERVAVLSALTDQELLDVVSAELSSAHLGEESTGSEVKALQWLENMLEKSAQGICNHVAVQAAIGADGSSEMDDSIAVATALLAVMADGDPMVTLASAAAVLIARRGLRRMCNGLAQG